MIISIDVYDLDPKESIAGIHKIDKSQCNNEIGSPRTEGEINGYEK
jgi:hypothetical protein